MSGVYCQLAGGINWRLIVGLGYADFRQLKFASGGWRLGVGIITCYKEAPSPIQVFTICIGGRVCFSFVVFQCTFTYKV